MILPNILEFFCRRVMLIQNKESIQFTSLMIGIFTTLLFMDHCFYFISRMFPFPRGKGRTFTIFGVLLYLIGLNVVSPITSTKLMAPTNRYVNVSTLAMSTNYYGTTTTKLNPFLFSYTFPYVQANTNYQESWSIVELNYEFPTSNKLNYSVYEQARSTSALTYGFYTSNANKINRLVINVVVVQPGFLGLLQTIQLTFDGGWPFTPGYVYSVTFSGLPSTTVSGSTVHSTILGMDLVTFDSSHEVGLTIAVVFTSKTAIKVDVTNIGNKKLTIYLLFFSGIFYNNVNLAAGSPSSKYFYGQYSSTNANNAALKWADTTGGLRSYNTFVGLRTVYIKGDNFFNYKISVQSEVGISSTSLNNWVKMGYDFIIFQFVYCTDPTPYFLTAQSLCYDICPIRYSQNTQYMECRACPTYDCYTCGMDNKCLTCSDTVDFRYMNNATMRCLPLPGYFDNGVSKAVACNPANCLTCTSLTVCVTCATGKFLTASETCIGCIANCDTCTTAANCQVCSNLYTFSSPSCIPNCSIVPHCTACSVISSALVCSDCSLGFQLYNNTCTPVCGDGIRVGNQSCDDGGNSSGDGCSSDCLIEQTYFCTDSFPNASNCSKCIDFCNICSNNYTCSNCSTDYAFDSASAACVIDCTVVGNCSSCFYNSTTATTECSTCLVGYSIVGVNNCSTICGDGIRMGNEVCDDGGNSSGDGCSSDCLIEQAYFCTDSFPNASNCSKCMDFCNVCSNNYTCSNCSTDYAFDSASAACVIDCTVVSNCSTCFYNASTAATECSTCLVGYSIVGTNNCSTICGDGIRAGNQACDDGGSSSGDGCSSDCLIEQAYFCIDTFPNASNCSKCMDFCDLCTSNSTCANCSFNYAFDSASAACVIDCSPISLCVACAVVSLNISCTQCIQGYSPISYVCQSVCGDGFRVGNQSCDDNNTANSDGCAANCTVEVGYFCMDNPSALTLNQSLCSPCIAECLQCADNSSCTLCKPNYVYLTAENSCFVDCSNIILCSTCNFTTALNCQTCSLGYKVSSNLCVNDCGDGIIVVEEGCDDGNHADNDGCSSTCTLQPKFHCAKINVNGYLKSQCSPCIADCDQCLTSALDCDICAPSYLHTVNGSGNASCLYDCKDYSNCTLCNPLHCTVCSYGFGFEGGNFVCKPVCGDGMINYEDCDDNNTQNGDGCSNGCSVEPNFSCKVVNGLSVCSLLSASINYVGVNKVSTSNTVEIQYAVSPKDLPAFAKLDWKAVVAEQSALGLTVTSVTFDPQTGLVKFTADYTQPLNEKTAQLSFTFPPTAPFDLLNSTTATVKLTADNNLSLEVYSEDDYSSAALVKTLATAASLLALAMFLFGAFAGKLIGIELIAVFQISFLSLTTLENLSPSFDSLSMLAYSCGFAVKNIQPSTAKVGRRFNPLSLKAPFLENYNVTAVMIVLPLILSLIFWLVNRLKHKGESKKLKRYSAQCKGELCFYGMMFSAYTIVVAEALDLLSSQPEFMGVGVGAVLLLALVLFGVLLHKYPLMFGEFRNRFNSMRVIQSHFYCFLIVERVVTAGIIAASPFQPTQAIIIGILALQLGTVVIAKPYKGDGAWLRPFLNLLISILVELIYLLTPQLGSSMPQFSAYAPFAIVGLLMIAVAYSGYCFVKQIIALKAKEAEQSQQPLIEQQTFMKGERAKLQMFKENVYNNLNLSFESQLQDPDSPIKLLSHEGISSLKEELNKVKIVHKPPTPVYAAMSRQINVLQDDLI